ncbi:sensor histidine kinase [Actinomadura alba]|uniref:histidine kinase n=1 Tax=Actinomadura alba TaxID=406431 RepID=A0ABR7LVS7_9ACTN|nr:HAMP domain-containing sensor histidine kinase [Actinomadura alba]MBC6468855.1 HAMP domain-containing histidine kinase [Actinomadura alba]
MADDKADTSAARSGTVRVRLTLAAVAVVGLALVAGAIGLVFVLESTLTNEVHSAAGSRARDVAAFLNSGGEPESAAAGAERDDEQFVQILDARGRVVVSSPDAAGPAAVTRLRPGRSARVKTPVDDDAFLAVAAGTEDGRFTVIVGRALTGVADSTQIVTRLLLIGVPPLLLVVAFTAWTMVGRALAPVEAIRREVDEISAAALHRRVPEPARTDEIGRLATTMNRMLDRLERAQASQRRFVSDASHELRSPVASIRQHAEVALAHPGRAITGELAQTVLAEGLRVQRLVDDLLLLTRADEHTLRVARRPVDLDDLVFEEARRLRAANTLRIDSSGVSAARVDGDAMGLRRVLRNLADNAARHARHRVAFTLTEADGRVLLTVDDDGPGIPEEERQRVLERFVRLDDARTRDEGGSGLGLAIVAELVAAHGGTFTLTGSDLGGARARVVLPRTGSG